MKNLNQIIKIQLRKVIEEQETENYMFFSNLEQIKRQCELLLSFDKQMIENLLQNGHDWADDHVSEAKNNMDQVFDFIMNEKEKGQTVNEASSAAQQAAIAINMKKKGIKPKNESVEMEIDESKNCPTDPAKWAASKAAAKRKFDVYPSAYANGWAAKNYKAKGGGWKKCK
jgi:septation ring formation regulator EzrA